MFVSLPELRGLFTNKLITTVPYFLTTRLYRLAVHIMAFIKMAEHLMCSRAVLQIEVKTSLEPA